MRISLRGILRDLFTNLKPRELFYWLIGNVVYWGFHLGMRVELYGMAEHYGPRAPATLVIGAHKRDWDPILFAAYSYYHRGWLAPDGRRIAFAGRSDIWERGFLATVIGYKNWPRWMQRLLDRTNFAPIANRMRGYPILRLPEYSLRQYLRSMLKAEGDLPLSEVLSEDTLVAFARFDEKLHGHKERRKRETVRPLHLSEVLGWNYRPLTARRIHAAYLAAGRYERLREQMRAQVAQQLGALARSMEKGDTLWFAPEGAVTLDGKVMRLRGGLQTLLGKARFDLRCLPSNVTYDFMTNRRRITACIGVGPELAGLRALDQAALAEQVSTALARQTVVTMSQLASARLMAHLDGLDFQLRPDEEIELLAAEARRLAGLGAWVQRDLLSERGLRRRFRAFLAYAQAQQLLIPDGAGSYLISARKIQGTRSSTFWENPVRYSANELAALEETLQPPPTLEAAEVEEPSAAPQTPRAAEETGQPDQVSIDAAAN
jgi:hypothetical protein